MIEKYDILLGSQLVGKAEVTREGLYYRFCCQCDLSGEVMYQLKVICGEKENSLGICVPVTGGFGVNKCLPIKTVGEGNFSFYVSPRHSDLKGKFIPIRADEPFTYIENLQNMHLEFCNGGPGVLIDDKSVRDTDALPN